MIHDDIQVYPIIVRVQCVLIIIMHQGEYSLRQCSRANKQLNDSEQQNNPRVCSQKFN